MTFQELPNEPDDDDKLNDSYENPNPEDDLKNLSEEEIIEKAASIEGIRDAIAGLNPDEIREFILGLFATIGKFDGSKYKEDPTIPDNSLSKNFAELTPIFQVGEILSHLNTALFGLSQYVHKDNKTEEIRELFERMIVMQDEIEEMHNNLKNPKEDEIFSLEELAELGLPLDSKITPSEHYMQKGEAKPPTTHTLDKYSVDLTALARARKLDPVIGVEKYVWRLAQILCRRKKANAALIGETGIGKTAIVEAFAIAVENDEFPDFDSSSTRVVVIDIPAILSGTKFRGNFESRMIKILEEIKNSQDTIIPFFDEMHTIVESGVAYSEDGSRSADTAEILIPYLTNGNFSFIGATTLSEYQKYIERNTHLSKSFMQILIDEPSLNDTYEILVGLRMRYEKHHNVKYSDDVLQYAITSANKYLPQSFFPDKAIDLIDLAGATVRAKTAKETKGPEKQIVITLADMDSAASSKSGIPLSLISRTDMQTIESLRDDFEENVVGQAEAVTRITNAVMRRKSGLGNTNRPIGSFLFVGPHGTGMDTVVKTATKSLYGNTEESLIHIDLAQFQSEMDISRLIGNPPGIKGYGEPGLLTEQIKRKPYSIVYLDRIELAYPGILNLCLQMLEEGRLTDGSGKTVSFNNSILILATGSVERCFFSPKEATKEKDFENYDWFLDGDVEINSKSRDELKIDVMKMLSNIHLPEILGRVDPVIFRPLSESERRLVLEKQIESVETILETRKNIQVKVTTRAREFLCNHDYNVRKGGHGLADNIKKYLSDPIFNVISENRASGSAVSVEHKRNDDELSFKWS